MANPNSDCHHNTVNPARVNITYSAPNDANNHAAATVVAADAIANPDTFNIVNPACVAITFAALVPPPPDDDNALAPNNNIIQPHVPIFPIIPPPVVPDLTSSNQGELDRTRGSAGVPVETVQDTNVSNEEPMQAFNVDAGLEGGQVSQEQNVGNNLQSSEITDAPGSSTQGQINRTRDSAGVQEETILSISEETRQEIIEVSSSSNLPGDDPPQGSSSNGNNERHIPAKLYKAALQGELDLATACIENERQLNYSRLTTNVITPKGNSILHIHVAVPVDVQPVSVKFLNHFLEKNCNLLTFKNDRQETALHLAASFGQLKAVKLFLDEDDNLFTLINDDGDTALHMAARNKHTSIVRYMCTLQQSLSIVNSKNKAGETPFYLGVQSGSEDLVKVIRDGIYKQNGDIPATESILHTAIIWGNKDMVTKLNYGNKRLLQTIDKHGQTPIHYAAGIDNAVLKAVLEAALSDPKSHTVVYIQDNQGRTAAHVAAQMNNVDGLKLLMKHFPDICEITDNQGRNIVHYSAFLGHFEALDYFLSEIQFSNLVNKIDIDGNTPLHLLVKALQEKLPVRLSSLKRLRSLIPKLSKLQVMSYNGEHKTPGDIASSIKFTTESGSAIRKNVVREIRMIAPKGRRVKQWIPPLQEYKKDIEAQPEAYITNGMSAAAGSHMVVAALIATVSFTAGLAVPGGFDADTKIKGEEGTAMLSHSKAFQAFLFTDCFALVSSLTAILCYFFFVVFPAGKRIRQHLFTWGFRATSISIIMLMAAFLTGTYSYFKPSQKIVVVILFLVAPVVASIFVTFALSLIVRSIPGNQPRWQNNKLKWQLLHGHVSDTTTILDASSTIRSWIIAAIITLLIIVGVYIIC